MKSSGPGSATVLAVLALITCSAQLTLGQDQPTKPAPTEVLRVVDYQGHLGALLNALADTNGVVIGFETDSQLPSMSTELIVQRKKRHQSSFTGITQAPIDAGPEGRFTPVQVEVDSTL